MKYVLLFSIVALTACVSAPITEPNGPGGAVSAVDSMGVTFTDQGKALWIREGVPAEWFQGNHLSDLYWHAGMQIRLKRANDGSLLAIPDHK